jgi:PII-like signaling protein
MTSNSQTGKRNMMVLRLYFPHAARVAHSRLWHHLSRPSLANHLLHLAKKDGIDQALVHHVDAGYLHGDTRIRHRHVEHSHRNLPQCLELIDTEATLRAFCKTHRHQLALARVLLLPCEVIDDHGLELD